MTDVSGEEVSARTFTHRRPVVYVMVENTVLAVSFCIAVLMIGLLLLPDREYASIDIDQLGEMKAEYLMFGSETYLIFKLSEPFQRSRDGLVQPARRIGKTIDPPVGNQQVGPYRVFSVHEYNGFIMLPDRKWWSNTVPCDDLGVKSETFDYNNRLLTGAISCRRSISAWWRGDKRLVYDLDGFAMAKGLANLYVPKYHVYRGEIHIGSNHAH